MRYPTIFEDDEEIRLPFKWVICSKCRGNGKHSLALGAMTMDYMHGEGQEFIENYFAGNYDKTCEDCDGSGKVPVADLAKLTRDQKKVWREVQDDLADMRTEELAEYRMSGEYLADLRSGY